MGTAALEALREGVAMITTTVDAFGWLPPHGQTVPRPVERAAVRSIAPTTFKVYQYGINGMVLLGRIIADSLEYPPIVSDANIQTIQADPYRWSHQLSKQKRKSRVIDFATWEGEVLTA